MRLPEKSANESKSNAAKCIGCKRCIHEIGCPAISLTQAGKAVIDENLCYGCDLCSQICPVHAIGGAQK